MKFKNLMCFKNTDPDPDIPDLKFKISGSGFCLDGSKILLSGYPIFGGPGADFKSNSDLE